ncbi:MAG: hypothetical protein QOH55_1801 [Microbacteriaceae bacterium]|jgi:hypothetical protein|nr:hypothetical protein [Microbacteriaceae bacterium]
MTISQLRRIAQQQGFHIQQRGDHLTLIDLATNSVGFGGTTAEIERYFEHEG